MGLLGAGLLSFFFHVLLRKDQGVELILENAVNPQNQTLGQVIGQGRSHRLLTEFSLGSDGFGCPDGGIFLGEDDRFPTFVFVEGKRKPFAEEYMEPRSPASVTADLDDYGRRTVYSRIKGFNSKINGQLELRWRFVNALQTTMQGQIVSERTSNPPLELLANDVFYLHHDLEPRPGIPDQWRRVDMRADLNCLFNSLRGVKHFYLLASTTDHGFPSLMNKVRLFDSNGVRLPDPTRRLFWMPLDVVRQQLEVWTAGGSPRLEGR